MSEESVAEVAAESVLEASEAPVEASEGIDEPKEAAFDASSQFAAISRKEKALLAREQALKDSEAKYSKYGDLESQVKENPSAILEHYGLSLDDIIMNALGEDAPEPTTDDRVSQLQKEIEAMKQSKLDEQDALTKKEEELAQNDIDVAIKSHKEQIMNVINDNADKYELINLQDGQDMVWEVTEKHFGDTGLILTPEEAADKVEDWYTEQVTKALGLNKFQPLVEMREEKVEEVKESIVDRYEDKRSTRPTLTQNYLTANPSKKEITNTNLSKEDSKALAAKKLDELWKKQRS